MPVDVLLQHALDPMNPGFPLNLWRQPYFDQERVQLKRTFSQATESDQKRSALSLYYDNVNPFTCCKIRKQEI
jgi:hypothetical protein